MPTTNAASAPPTVSACARHAATLTISGEERAQIEVDTARGSGGRELRSVRRERFDQAVDRVLVGDDVDVQAGTRARRAR